MYQGNKKDENFWTVISAIFLIWLIVYGTKSWMELHKYNKPEVSACKSDCK